MELKLVYVDENNNIVNDPEIINKWQEEQEKEWAKERHTVTVTADDLPSHGHGLPPYIPGYGWVIDAELRSLLEGR